MANPPSPPDEAWPTREDDAFVRDPDTAVVTRPAAPPPDEPDRRFAWGLLVGMLVVALGAAVAAGAWLLTRDDDSGAAAPTTSADPTTTMPATAAGAKVAVPRLVGLTEREALVRLGEVGLRPREVYRPTKKATGVVVSQKPTEAKDVKRGSQVALVIDSGAPQVAVPDVRGLAADGAVAKLDDLGLDSRQTTVTSTKPTGSVVDQAPAAGTKRPKGSLVTLSVAKAAPLAVPDVVGQPEAAARSALDDAGFAVNVVPVPSNEPAGQVIAQRPRSGERAARGTAVRINVSKGSSDTATTQMATAATTTEATTAATTTTAVPKQVTVPDLTSTQLQQAMQRLAAAGLRASVQYIPGEDPLETVLNQSPQASATAQERAHVTLNVSSGPGDKPRQSVPDTLGRSLQQAVSTVNGAGLRLIFGKVPVTDRAQAGKVVEQTPTAGKTAPKNAQVLVYIGAFRG